MIRAFRFESYADSRAISTAAALLKCEKLSSFCLQQPRQRHGTTAEVNFSSFAKSSRVGIRPQLTVGHTPKPRFDTKVVFSKSCKPDMVTNQVPWHVLIPIAGHGRANLVVDQLTVPDDAILLRSTCIAMEVWIMHRDSQEGALAPPSERGIPQSRVRTTGTGSPIEER